MRVLGVDPGLTRCGVGVVDGELGRPLSLAGVEVVRTAGEADIAHRLLALEQGLEQLLERYVPDAVAVEAVFSQHNRRTVMGTAQAGAVSVCAAARRGIPVTFRTPSEVKAAVTGNGRADKSQVAAMVTRILRLDERPTPADASDALALAICEAWRGPGERLRAAAASAAIASGAGAVPGTASRPGAGSVSGTSAASMRRWSPS